MCELVAAVDTADGTYVISHVGEDVWHVTRPRSIRPKTFRSFSNAEAWIGRR